ncbi:hypothetical protein JTB14_015961 [Gonioctena quinquepunctata]|nr:hypothetical protein JTB14_015961 [Gonioctena quinquepunctata]
MVSMKAPYILSQIILRAALIEFDNNRSVVVKCNFGVHQGSILGPPLLSIYISDFGEFLGGSKVHQYVDDTQMYLSFAVDDCREAADGINSDLLELFEVSLAHNLKLDAAESKALIFG